MSKQHSKKDISNAPRGALLDEVLLSNYLHGMLRHKRFWLITKRLYIFNDLQMGELREYQLNHERGA